MMFDLAFFAAAAAIGVYVAGFWLALMATLAIGVAGLTAHGLARLITTRLPASRGGD